jgi:hypothetical protein
MRADSHIFFVKRIFAKRHSMARPRPSFEQILASLQNEVLFGKAYLVIAKGLEAADPIVLQTAQTFFGLAHEASLQVSQMLAAKLFDMTNGAVTVESLLSAAASQAASFQNGRADQVLAAIDKSKNCIANLQPILKSIRKRRNKALAHLDPGSVINPRALATSAKLPIADLEKVFDQTAVILNEISCLYNGIVSVFDFVDGNDYETAMRLIAKAKCAQADEYERETNHP